MAIDLGSGNSTRYYTVPDHADLSLPNGDWSWVTLCYWPSGQLLANGYYIVSTGTVSTANSFNLFLGAGTNYPFVAVNTDPLVFVEGIAPQDKWMIFYATRRSNALYVGQCALGVSSATESPGQSLTAGSNGTGLHIGSRNDLNTARFWSGRIGQVAFVPGYGVTQADVVALANGAPMLSMPFAPQIKFLLHPRTASSTVTDIIGGKVATRFGSGYGANEEDVLTPYIWTPTYIRGVEPSEVTEHNLAGANATQANAASTASISQAHALSAQASAQVNSASAAAITQSHAVTGSASAQSNVASTGAISQGAQFAADPATQANTVSAGAITQAHALAGAGSTQSNTASAASITQTHALTGASATQANTAAQGAISQGTVHDLSASAATQANTGAAGAITQAHVLVSAPSIQDNIAAASAIVQAHVLAALSALQANAASAGAIEQTSGIPPVDAPAGSGPRLRIVRSRRPAQLR